MTWTVVKKQSKPTTGEDLNGPVRLYFSREGARITFYREWLKANDLQDSTRVTVLIDSKQRLIAFQFLETDLMNGYSLSRVNTRTTNRLQITAKTATEQAIKWGYPIKTCLSVVQDANNPHIWVLQKKGAVRAPHAN